MEKDYQFNVTIKWSSNAQGESYEDAKETLKEIFEAEYNIKLKDSEIELCKDKEES